jgi:hypothetical protein
LQTGGNVKNGFWEKGYGNGGYSLFSCGDYRKK